MTQAPIRVLYSDIDSSRCSPEPLKQRSGEQPMSPLAAGPKRPSESCNLLLIYLIVPPIA